jgi:hypothetical protein
MVSLMGVDKYNDVYSAVGHNQIHDKELNNQAEAFIDEVWYQVTMETKWLAEYIHGKQISDFRCTGIYNLSNRGIVVDYYGNINNGLTLVNGNIGIEHTEVMVIGLLQDLTKIYH